MTGWKIHHLKMYFLLKMEVLHPNILSNDEGQNLEIQNTKHPIGCMYSIYLRLVDFYGKYTIHTAYGSYSHETGT